MTTLHIPLGGGGGSLPSGGTLNQYLGKNSATDGDASWKTLPNSGAAGEDVFTVVGADKTGVTNSWTAVKTQWDAAIANGGGIVQLPPGIIQLDGGSGVQGLSMPAGLSGRLWLRGWGKTRTTLKMTSNTRCVVVCGVSGQAVGTTTTIQNLEMSDFTVDAGSTTGSSLSVVFHLVTRVNVKNLKFHDIWTKNVGGLNAVSARNNIAILQYTNPLDPADALTCTDVKVQRCRFGDSGGGGTFGVQIGALALTAVSGGTMDMALLDKHRNYVYYDDIEIDEVYWNSGTTITGNIVSDGILVGSNGYGRRLRISNCWVQNSGDDGIETNGMSDVVVSNCVCVDTYNAGFVQRNIGGVYPPSQQNVHYIDCRQICDTWVSPGFWALTTNSTKLGNLVYDNCVVEINPAVLPARFLGSAFRATGIIESATYRNCRRLVNGWSFAPTANSQTLQDGLLNFEQNGGAGRLVVDGLHDDLSASYPGGSFTGLAWTHGMITVSGTDVLLDIRNVTNRLDVAHTGNGSFISRMLQFSGGRAHTDNFASDSWTRGDYIVDLGTSTDLAISGGALTSVANHGVEKVARWGGSISDANGASYGPYTDGAPWVKGTYAQSAGFKLGVIGKATDNLNRLEAYLTDDGTNTIFNIDRIVAGARTNLQTSTLGARLSAGTSYWVRMIQRGNTVIADYFTSVPSTTVVSASGVVTLTQALSATDARTFGAGVQGFAGFTWTPSASSSTLDDMQFVRMNVTRGSVKGLVMRGIDPSITTGTFYGVDFGVAATEARITNMTISDCDFTTLDQVASPTDVGGLATFGTQVTVKDIAWANPPAAAAITPGASPYTYTNADGYDEDVAVYGGTVSVITVQHGSATAGQIGTTGPVTARLAPGDSMTVTYSSVPTMRKIPVL